MNIYNNYHKHDHLSSIITPDTHIKAVEYFNRAIELGHTAYFTTNHGTGGDIFEAYLLSEEYGIKSIFGIEGYIVPNPLEANNRNYHIMIIPKTDKARKKVNIITSRAFIEGFYYKPRIFLKDLLSLDKDDVYITTACVAGIMRDKEGIEQLVMPLLEHFGDNLFFEVQNHDDAFQKEINKKCIEFSKKYGNALIAANDSHYIYPEQATDRLNYLKGKGISYGGEDNYILDYPDYDTMLERFINQGVLSEEQARRAIDQTLIFSDINNIKLNKEIKMPSIYKDLSPEQKVDLLSEHAYTAFEDVKVIDELTEDEIPTYVQGIEDELQVIRDTSSVNTADYFLFNEKNTDLAINKYGGVLTRTGRGSCSSFYVNRLLGMTQIDRFKTPVKLYPERFLSTARILETRSLPDIDFNVVEQEPFVKASRELLGEHGCYPMVAYGTMKLSESFRNICRSYNLPYSKYNEVAKAVETYEDDTEWSFYITEAKKFVGSIVSISPHPCAHLLLDKDIIEEYGVIRIGDAICVLLTSDEADKFKFLKNDYLVVSCWKLISETFDMIHQPILTTTQLNKRLDDKIWQLYKDGYTNTLNQCDGTWATGLVKKYHPESLRELSMFVAALRPSFESWRDRFINRDDYNTGCKQLDEVLESTNSFILFQENLMQFFEWLGIAPAESISIIKKISKKKIKQSDFDALEDRLHNQWIENVGNDNLFNDIWSMIQSCISYGFCVSGKTRLYRNGNSKNTPTIEEMYKIRNDLQYAKKTNHYNLRSKYRSYGYGKCLSLYSDNLIRENNIIDIYYMGKQQTFTIITKGGRTITCTSNHKFPTPLGEKQLYDLTVGDELYCVGTYSPRKKSYRLTNIGSENNFPQKGQCGFQKRPNGASVIFESERDRHKENKDCCEMCGCEINDNFELHHIDLDRTNNDPSNFMWLCNSCHKKIHYKRDRNKRYQRGLEYLLDTIISITPNEIEDVYNVEMADPAHNFAIDNGLITSNCSAHAVCTAYDSLYSAYLKVNYTNAYYTVCLDTYRSDQGKVSTLISEMKNFDVKVLPPSINRSMKGFIPYKGQILFGLSAITGIGEKLADMIIQEREANGDFKGFDDFLSRVSINKSNMVYLIKAGAIPTKDKKKTIIKFLESQFTIEPFEYKPVKTYKTKKVMLEEWGIDVDAYKVDGKIDKDKVLEVYNILREKRLKKDYYARKYAEHQNYIDTYTEKYLQDEPLWEFQALQIFLNNNPFDESFKYITRIFTDIEENDDCVIVGVIAKVEKKKNKMNKQYAFVHIYSTFGIIEALVFAQKYQQYSELLYKGNQIAMLCTKSNDNQVLCEQVKPYNDWLEYSKKRAKKGR